MKSIFIISLVAIVSLINCNKKVVSHDDSHVNQSLMANRTVSNIVQRIGLVDKQFVCMTQDAVYPKKLVKVDHNNKVYYGCCAGCAQSIREETQKYGFSTDPITKRKVNKADAVILNYNGKALYFSSKINARKYVKNSGEKVVF